MSESSLYVYRPFQAVHYRNMLDDPPMWAAWQRDCAQEAAQQGYVLGAFDHVDDLGMIEWHGFVFEAVALYWSATPLTHAEAS